MFDILEKYGNREQAIKYAEKLDVLHSGKTPVDSKPSTKVYLLVKELIPYF